MSFTARSIFVPRGHVCERNDRNSYGVRFIQPPTPINVPSESFSAKTTLVSGPKRKINSQQSDALEGARGIVVGPVLGSISWGLLGFLGYVLLF